MSRKREHTHRWYEVARYGWRKVRIIYRCFCGETGYSAP